MKFNEVHQVNAANTGHDSQVDSSAIMDLNFPFLRRDFNDADWHAALLECDNVLEAISMILEGGINHSDNGAKLIHPGINLDCSPEVSDLLSSSILISSTDHNNHSESRLPQREQVDKKSDLGPTRKRKQGNLKSQSKSGSTAPRKRKPVKDQQIIDKVEKIELEDDSKSDILSGAQIDTSLNPPPFCSCTGCNRQCYKWGSGGWQSSCCTSSLSEYPLPMKTNRHGSRIAGRKMSGGAFKKLLDRLAGQGIDVTQPIDLKKHWAKHGSNRFMIVR
ncbi:hypothetical protein KP509_09G047500 [Ceratopteris richardii]|nr:hypothetical protein KP509_09G047500 [Ceratopteris richardii]KAH7429433.1 hypothetical protein KP509_09G047500 [Ceratopteris richardii]KAH7429434.1 hypothetical protein KP509_09G047500 [Ceratopteris richardii]KAH7429436.1 hypothetical protein KP509_09G047500 [Ceratopteris richardii]